MERLRDFMYDISDLLISLLIIAAIFAVISWKLNESIPIETASAPPAAEAEASEPVAEPAQAEADAETPVDASAEIDDASDADKPIAEQPVTEAPQTTVQAPVVPKPTAPAASTAVTLEIPSGSPGVAIAKLLKDKGLITDVNTFIQKVDELGLGSKLQSGTYKLKTGMSLEQIIKTLANVN